MRSLITTKIKDKTYICKEEGDRYSDAIECTAPTPEEAALLYCKLSDEGGEYAIVKRSYATVIVIEKDGDGEEHNFDVQAEAVPHYYIS